MENSDVKKLADGIVTMLRMDGYTIDRLIGINQFAGIIGKSKKTVYNNIGRYDHKKVGRKLMFSEAYAYDIANGRVR